MQSLLQVAHLSKSYGHKYALREVSFSIRPGEILGVIGPNGAGKTTLFECVAGVAPATSGGVEQAGAPVSADARKRALFYVAEGCAPWPDQPVTWALSFVAGMFGRPASEREDVIRQLSLGPLLSSRLGTLSKGEHRRALLAVGLLSTQPVLMLDEPFDGLDLRQTREMMAVLLAHARAGRALVLSIHQLTDASRICDRLVLLSDGRVVGDGTLDALRAQAGVTAGGLEEVFLALA